MPIAGPLKQTFVVPLKRVARQMVIAAKWLKDRQHLPLTPQHKAIYQNIHNLSWSQLGRFPNLIDCQDYNDKIHWLKLFDQQPEMVRCVDKLLVRDVVKERVGESYLVKLYQAHAQFSDIDFDALPSAFVIKTNHDSGTVILVRDKTTLDRASAKQRIDQALPRVYGWDEGEWAYAYVKPKVFVEEFIEPEKLSPPPDYKFHCVNGRVKFLQFIANRGMDPSEQIIDTNGNDLHIQFDNHFKAGAPFVKPARWAEMIQVSEAISQGFKYVRVDLYCSGERVYVGEMTFWPLAGVYEGPGQKQLSPYIDFDRSQPTPLISGQDTVAEFPRRATMR